MKLGDVAEKEIDCFSRKIREIGAQKNERNILFSRKIREIERCKKKMVTYIHGKFVKLGDVAEKEIDCFSRKIREFGCCRKTSIECSHGKCMKFAGDVAEKKERKK